MDWIDMIDNCSNYEFCKNTIQNMYMIGFTSLKIVILG